MSDTPAEAARPAPSNLSAEAEGREANGGGTTGGGEGGGVEHHAHEPSGAIGVSGEPSQSQHPYMDSDWRMIGGELVQQHHFDAGSPPEEPKGPKPVQAEGESDKDYFYRLLAWS